MMFKQISRFKKGIPILVMSILLGIQIGLSAKTVLGIQKRFYITQKIDSAPPIIDGKLTEKIWQNVKWEGNFIQIIPEEGKKSSEKTRFKIIYDNRYLYIAIRADDRTPDKIIRRLDRHDSHDGDWVAVNIDSYHDLSTAFCFTVNAAGVRADKLISNNGDKHDGSWDPIWQAKTSIDEQGWLAELRIPLDQLRFSNADKMTWGL